MRAEGVWVSRELAPGWVLRHRVVLEGATPVIAETSVVPHEGQPIRPGGVASDLLRLITLRGVQEAAAPRLLGMGHQQRPDLRALEASTGATRRRGEARRWSLALTSWAFAKAVKEGSRHPAVDAATALGIRRKGAIDRLHDARRHRPPLLGGGGKRGVVGEAALTEAGNQVIEDRLKRVMASLGYPPDRSEFLGFQGTVGVFDATQQLLLVDAERRIPGLWDMSLDEVARAARETQPPMIEVPAGKGLQVGPDGVKVVDVDEAGRPA